MTKNYNLEGSVSISTCDFEARPLATNTAVPKAAEYRMVCNRTFEMFLNLINQLLTLFPQL